MSNSADQSRTLRVIKTDAEWREQLTPIQYQITRQHGTERAFSSPNFDSSLHGSSLLHERKRTDLRSRIIT